MLFFINKHKKVILPNGTLTFPEKCMIVLTKMVRKKRQNFRNKVKFGDHAGIFSTSTIFFCFELDAAENNVF